MYQSLVWFRATRLISSIFFAATQIQHPIILVSMKQRNKLKCRVLKNVITSQQHVPVSSEFFIISFLKFFQSTRHVLHVKSALVHENGFQS